MFFKNTLLSFLGIHWRFKLLLRTVRGMAQAKPLAL